MPAGAVTEYRTNSGTLCSNLGGKLSKRGALCWQAIHGITRRIASAGNADLNLYHRQLYTFEQANVALDKAGVNILDCPKQSQSRKSLFHYLLRGQHRWFIPSQSVRVLSAALPES